MVLLVAYSVRNQSSKSPVYMLSCLDPTCVSFISVLSWTAQLTSFKVCLIHKLSELIERKGVTCVLSLLLLLQHDRTQGEVRLV